LDVAIHPSAIVEEGAVVGAGTRIWHHAHVRSGALIGENCNLGKDVYVDIGVVIGSGVKIQNGVSVYRGVELGDDVFVGPHATFTNDPLPRAHSEDWTPIPTWVRDGASIGAHATILCGVELGTNCMVGAGAVVTKSVEPHELVFGNPARHRGWVCRCGRVISRAEEPPASFVCERCAQK
jgi:UDP-2-acetamido-3-amino-2,3-dideoxy-glucuronate N-acetyltransferase